MSEGRDRFCVFCGEEPNKKTREHILPQWLIRLTGDPNRNMLLGPFVGKDELYKSFSFSAFTFPACHDCNSKFSRLERRAYPLVQRMLDSRPLSQDDFNLFLDWLDKVRIGIWLGYYHYLSENQFGITPKFYINKRVGSRDRMVVIYRSTEAPQRLQFSGMNNPAFFHMPSCFLLIVNDLYFLNISREHLLAERLGLPYASATQVFTQERLMGVIVPGKEVIETPLMDFDYDARGTSVFQGIYGAEREAAARLHGSSMASELYDTDYIRKLTMPRHDGRTIIFLQKEGEVLEYPRARSAKWCPPRVPDYRELNRLLTLQTLHIQIRLFEQLDILPGFIAKAQQHWRGMKHHCIEVNQAMIDALER